MRKDAEADRLSEMRFGGRVTVSSGMYTAGHAGSAHPAPAGGQGRWSGRCRQRADPVASHTLLSVQLPGALTQRGSPLFRGNGPRGLALRTGAVDRTGEDSVVAGHRGYLSPRGRAAGKPRKAAS